MSTGCPNDAAICKFVEQSHPGSNEEISPYSIAKLKSPPSFTDFIGDESKDLLESQFSLNLIWLIIVGIPQGRDRNPLPLVGSWTHFNKQISCKTFQKTLIKYVPIIPESVSDFAVLKFSMWRQQRTWRSSKYSVIVTRLFIQSYFKLYGSTVMSSPKLSDLWVAFTMCFACRKQFINVMLVLG